MLIPGGASAEGTARLAARFPGVGGRFRPAATGWTLSSIGLGTFGGDPDGETDAAYAEAIGRALELGCNVIDTAGAYRHQRSERVIGATLETLIGAGRAARDEIVICSKAGFLSFDQAYSGGMIDYYRTTLAAAGITSPHDVVSPGHCLAPGFIDHQLEQSRRNLRCGRVDVYYLHNPETQLNGVEHGEFLNRIRLAFERLEHAVDQQRIGVYGISTWAGGRLEAGAARHLDLPAIFRCATEVGGPKHHFRALLLPLNVVQTEALTLANQPSGPEDRFVPLLASARDLGLTVMAGAPLHRGRLAAGWPGPTAADASTGLETRAQHALQLVRSTPGVTSAIVGMSTRDHVDENLAVLDVEALPAASVGRCYGKSGEAA